MLKVALGFGEVDIRTASAVAVVQVTAATFSGALAHRRRGGIHLRLAITMSVASAVGASATLSHSRNHAAVTAS